MTFVRRWALVLGALGCVFSSLAFAASFASPGFVEQVARQVIRQEVEKRVQEKIDALDERFLLRHAQVLARGQAERMAQARQAVAQQLPERLSQVIAEMADLDCECRKKVEAGIRGGLEAEAAGASALHEKLTVLIRTKYLETARQVVREFRIFTGTSALVFAVLLAVVLLKPRAGLHLLPSAALLLVAALVTGYLYLFNQDWLHTLVFNDYVGFGYLAYLGGAFALLGDVVLNKARVTAEVLRLVLEAAGSAVEVVPC